MTEVVDLLRTGGPYAVTAISLAWSWTLYRDLRARDAQIFELLSRTARFLSDGKDGER